MRCNAPRLDHDLDGVVDVILRVTQRGRQIVERESVGVKLGGVKTLLTHQRRSPTDRASSLAANAVDVNIVADHMGDVDEHGGMRKRGKADFPAAIDHVDRLIYRVWRA